MMMLEPMSEAEFAENMRAVEAFSAALQKACTDADWAALWRACGGQYHPAAPPAAGGGVVP